MSALDAVDAGSEAVRKPGTFRVTADSLRQRVTSTEYVVRGILTVALVQLDNGYWIVGKSAPVDPANFNAEYGQTLALDDALRQAWPLVAFAHLDGAPLRDGIRNALGHDELPSDAGLVADVEDAVRTRRAMASASEVKDCSCQNPDATHPVGDEAYCNHSA